MSDHGARAHARWSASATARLTHCPGSLTLSELAPKSSSVYADTGTAVHQIAERCLRDGGDAIRFLDTVEDAKTSQILITEPLVESAQVYVDYVRRVVADNPDAVLLIEQKFSLDSLQPPFEAGGTSDAVVYAPATRTLHAIDLKNGTKPVEAKANPQLRTYGVGALLANPDFKVDHVTTTIVQPNAFHKEGRIRSETLHVADLIDWTVSLMMSMWRAKQAEEEFSFSKHNSITREGWDETWLKPGECHWCDAKGFCPALRKAAIDRKAGIAQTWFEDSGEMKIANQPDMMGLGELATTLDNLETLEQWIKAVRAYAHTLAEHGKEIPGYFLADKIGNRKWAADEAKVVSDLRSVVKLTDDDIFEAPKLKSVAGIEKVLGAKRKAEIANMFMRPVTGKNLVAVDKTNRTPAASVADKYFETGE